MQCKIKPWKYKHYKWRLYEVIWIAKHSETLEDMVVYQALYDDEKFGKNSLWVRSKKMFLETVEVNWKKIKRFEKIEKEWFDHKALNKLDQKKLVFTAFSKKNFFFKHHISNFVLKIWYIPINPFMNFDYFMLDTIDRDTIRNANNNLLVNSDELRVFGSISDGVLAEIKIMKELNKPIKYYNIIDSKKIIPIQKEKVDFEDQLEQFKYEL